MEDGTEQEIFAFHLLDFSLKPFDHWDDLCNVLWIPWILTLLWFPSS